MTAHVGDREALLTPAEVAALFRVDPKTVTRWAKAGKLTSIRTLGGHRRYPADEVHALLERFATNAEPATSTPQTAPAHASATPSRSTQASTRSAAGTVPAQANGPRPSSQLRPASTPVSGSRAAR
jgi:excisionase family DNA binding protein